MDGNFQIAPTGRISDKASGVSIYERLGIDKMNLLGSKFQGTQ
jgi:hypothetical protein